MNTVNLQISLPGEIYQDLQKFVIGKNINDFVIDAIKKRINSREDSFIELLKEGYIANREEDKRISQEFLFSDLENWEE